MTSSAFLVLSELYAKKKANIAAKHASTRRKSEVRQSITLAPSDRRGSLLDQDAAIPTPAGFMPGPSHSPTHGPTPPAGKGGANWEGKWDRGGWDLGGKENYLAWCMIKSALRLTTARQSLQGLAASASNPDMTKPLTEKALHDMPDFILLELCPESPALRALSSRAGLLPIESLLPSRQHRPNLSISWLKVINYYNHLLRRCYWQKVALQLPDSDWDLHYHYATPRLFAKARAVLAFLSALCPHFKSCLMPPIPQLSMLPSGTFSPWAGSAVTPHIHREPQLMAGDADVTIIWYRSFLPPILSAADPTYKPHPSSDRIIGYFAMNLKPVNFPIHAEPYLLGIDTHVCHTSLSKLKEMHEDLEELSKAVKAYMDARSSIRPVSRSPLKQRKAEKSAHPPDELVRSVRKAVKDISCFFDSKAKEVNFELQWSLSNPAILGGFAKMS